MRKFSALAAAIAAAAFLGHSAVSQAQYFGGMGSGMMGPGFGFGTPGRSSAIARGTSYGFGMMAGNYCYGMMGPATGYGYSMMGPWTGSSYADPDAAVQACLASLQTQLGISAGQQAAWQGFADAIAQQAGHMLQFQQQVLQSSATAPERTAQYAQFMLQRAQDAAAVSQAVSALYGSLTATQQALFNQYFAWGA